VSTGLQKDGARVELAAALIEVSGATSRWSEEHWQSYQEVANA
jgi:hypothetical protein